MKTGIIDLTDPDHPYAYGHLTAEEAEQALADYDMDAYPCVPEHVWLRYVPTRDGVRICSATPGTQGAFKATRILSVAQMEYEASMIADIARRTEQLEVWVKERFPIADIINKSAWPTTTPFVSFQLDGLKQPVDTREIGFCYISQSDLEYFNQHYIQRENIQETEG